MQKTIQIGDTTHTVTLEPDGPGCFTATLSGRKLKLSVRPVNGAPRVLIVDGKPYPIAVAKDRDRTWVQVLAETFQCETVRGKKPAGAAGKKDPVVRCPIAGKVLKLFVAVGDKVVAGQKLISIEAMKMENEIHASLDGTVAKIAVAAGQPTQPGDILMVIEPSAPSSN